MPTSIIQSLKWTAAFAIALFGLSMVPYARAAQPEASQNGPKNLMSPTYRAPAVPAAVSKEFTKKDAKRLATTAESREDHLKLAGYYKAEADRLDAKASGYEDAAAAYRNGPMVKNLMAPTTAPRYEFLAKGFREEATSNRAVAASHEQMATNAVATVK